MLPSYRSYRRIFFVALGWVLTFSHCSFKKNRETSNLLRLGISSPIQSLDPAIAGSNVVASDQISYVYEGLLQYHYLKRPYQLVPLLAESMPEVSSDGLIYLIHIKKGVLFQDDRAFTKTGGKGRELVAEDFVYSFKRIADPRVRSTGWWIFENRIQGLDEWRSDILKTKQGDYSKKVEGLIAVGRYTLKIVLKKVSHQFLYYLAMPASFVVPQEAVHYYGGDFGSNPVGTGPFALNRRDSRLSSQLIWEKNPTFRSEMYPVEGTAEDKKEGLLEDAGKSIPFLDKVVVTVYSEDQPRWLNFLAQNLDLSNIPQDSYDELLTPTQQLNPQFEKKGILLHKLGLMDLTGTAFNMRDPILGKNKLLRQALSLAYNVEPVVEVFYNRGATAAQGPIPPGLDGYDRGFHNPYRQSSASKAKELLTQAGFPNGEGLPPLDYYSNESETARQFGEYLAKSLGSVGVKVNVQLLSWPEFMEKMEQGSGHLYGYAWVNDYPDAENSLQLFYSKHVPPGPNCSFFENPGYDQLYEQALQLKPGPPRTQLYQKMVSLLVEETPWIWGVHRIKFLLNHRWVKNIKVGDEIMRGQVKYYRVDPSLKH